MAEKVLSIEISPHLTKVVETERKSMKVVHGAFYFETPEDTYENGTVKSNPQFKLRLDKGLKENGIKTKKAIFIIQATNIGNKEEVMPKMKEAKIREYIDTNASTFFPNGGDSFKFTYRNNGTDEEGKMRAQLFAIPKNIIKSYEDLARACGLTLVDIEVVENGLAKIIRESYPNGTIISIDVESICTYLTIVKSGDIVLQRMIPFGIDEALTALKEADSLGMGLSYDKVFEETTKRDVFYKRLEGDGLEEDDIKDVATEEVRFVIGNLTRFIDYYMSQHTEEKIDKVIVSGLATYCKGFPILLANELNRELVLADSTIIREVANKKGVKNLGIYLSAIAAAANADNSVVSAGKKDKKLEFGKSSLVRADDDFTLAKKVFIIAVIIALLLALAGIGLKIYFDHTIDDLKSQISSYKDAKEINDKMQTAKANYDKAMAVDKLSTVANDKFLNLISELEANLPSDVVVTSIDADSDSVVVEVQSNSKQSIASLLSSIRTFNSVNIGDTIDIMSATNDVGVTQYSSSIKCEYKSDDDNSSSATASSSSSTTSNSTNSTSNSTNSSSNSSSSSSSSANKTN